MPRCRGREERWISVFRVKRPDDRSALRFSRDRCLTGISRVPGGKAAEKSDSGGVCASNRVKTVDF
jgi:hypothetical protein